MARAKKRTDGRYCKNVTIGHNEDGSLKRKMIYANTQKELELKVAEFTLQVDKGIVIDDKNMTFGAWAEKWFETYVENTNKANNTKSRYRVIVYNHIIPSLGNIKLKDLKQYQIQNAINEKLVEGFTFTTDKMKMLINEILDQAVENDYIYKNVAKKIKIKTYKAPEKEILTTEQIEAIKNKEHNMQEFVLFLIYSGLRLGEAIALTWADIDLKGRVIKVNKTAEFKKQETFTKETKTKSSNREVPIVEPLYILLDNMKKKTDSIYVFPYKSKMYPVGIISARRKYYCNKLGFNFTYHQCRHTCATMLYNAGVGIKEMQNWLGHSSLKTTMEIYTHLDKKNKENALSKMNEMLQAK